MCHIYVILFRCYSELFNYTENLIDHCSAFQFVLVYRFKYWILYTSAIVDFLFLL